MLTLFDDARHLLESLSVSSPVGVFLADRDSGWTLANARCREICGLSVDEATGMRWLEHVHPDDRERVEAAWYAAMRDTGPFSEQMRFQQSAGTLRAVCVCAAPWTGPGGVPGGFTGTVEDVAGRLRSEEALRAGEERFQAQYRGIPLPTYTWQASGDDWVLIDFNDAALAFTEGSIAQYRGATARSFFHHEPDILDDFAACARDHGSRRREMTHRLGSTGELREIVTHYAFVPPDLVMVHTEDISDRTAADRARAAVLVAEQEARLAAETAQRTLATVLERVPIGIVVVNADGYVALVNEACRRISGLLPADDLPLAQQADRYGITDPHTGKPMPAESTPIARALAGETIDHAEYTFQNPATDDVVWLGVAAAPLLDAAGGIAGAVAVFEDLTERRALEQQKDGFLSSAAHDLKSPLTTIKGFAQLLSRRLERDGTLTAEYAAPHLERIDTTVFQMTEMITEMLDLTSLQKDDHLALSPTRMDLRELVQSVVEHTVPAADRIRIRLEMPEPQVEGIWDPSRLRRVVSNLVTNAVTYSPDGGDISISLHSGVGQLGRVAILVVGDHGIGIAPGDLPHIFRRFYRGSNAADRFAGTGVGLSGVKGIVEQHGGTITVESVEGAGSTFTVTLPLAPPDVTPVPEE